MSSTISISPLRRQRDILCNPSAYHPHILQKFCTRINLSFVCITGLVWIVPAISKLSDVDREG